MDSSSFLRADNNVSLWFNSLVNGVGGLSLKAKAVLHSSASPFQKIEVIDTYACGRVLCLGGNVMFTERDEYVYHEMIVHPAMLMHPSPRRVCVIGGGDGGCLREVLRHGCVEQVRVVEIDPMVKETAERFFAAMTAGFKDKRAAVMFGDGFEYLSGVKESFDVIIVDSFDPGGPVQSLQTAGFDRVVRDRLADGGIVVVQTDSPTLNPDLLRRTSASLSTLYPSCRAYFCAIPSFADGVCTFLVAGKQEGTLEKIDTKRYDAIAETLRYFSREVFTGAFLLPRHIRRLAG